MRIVKNGRVVENVPLILNLLKDSSWCYAWVWVGTIAVVPILSYQIYEIWKCRKDVHQTVRSVVAGLVLSANATWMFGDFYFGQDHLRNVARWVFSIGLVIGVAYILFVLRHRNDDDKVVMVHRELYSDARYHNLSQLRRIHRARMIHSRIHRSK